ncbi:thioredoxin family protein [Candidatus Sumerlaeota bacterium]|nr:thioredoxin family protein [Candidatus Sumerlaeota bacterium]
MAVTPSTMLPLQSAAPDFSLQSTEGRTVRLADFANSDVLVVMFLCNHCPYVKHIDQGLVAFARDYVGKRVAIVAISSNSVETHPQDGFEQMVEEKRKVGYTFPYLYDPTQEVAKAYQAACTPDFYVFDKDRKLQYRGQFDDSRPRTENPPPVTGKDLRAAVDALLDGKPPSPMQKPSIGCNIKWQPGNEPRWFGPKLG